MKRHPKTCQSFSEEEFFRHSHTKRKTTCDENQIEIFNITVESLEKLVPEMAKTIFVLQTELHIQEDIINDKIETEYIVVNMSQFWNTNQKTTILK